MTRVLLLGGTSEASELARTLVERPDIEFVTSFAGRTTRPRAHGASRVGGFGGADGLARYLREHAVDLLVDATHPFAAKMRWHAADAARACAIAHLRLEREPWRARPADRWREVGSVADALALLGPRDRAFVTLGRSELPAVAHVRTELTVVRTIEAPEVELSPETVVVRARGPFTLRDEAELLARYDVNVVVSKNSGGAATYAKIAAARQRGVEVVMVVRPPNPPVQLVREVAEAREWIDNQVTLMSASGTSAG